MRKVYVLGDAFFGVCVGGGTSSVLMKVTTKCTAFVALRVRKVGGMREERKRYRLD